MKTLLVALCLLFAALANGGEPTPADLLPGTWRGSHTANNSGYQHIITIQKQGDKFIGKSVTWSSITETQAQAAVKGQRPNAEYPKAVCVQQQFAITITGDIVTFKSTAVQAIVGLKKYVPDVFIGKLTAPGIVGGETADGKGIFHLWKEEVFKKPAALELEKGKTLKLDCLDGGKYHYTCYIPKNYDPEKTAPVLINFSPSGNATPLSPKMADETGWIMVGLTESKNGPVEPSYENRDAVLFDLRRRFNVEMKRIYFSGFSGGARCASESSLQYPGICAGLILIGASYGAGPPQKDVPIFFVAGETDMNRKEVEAAYATAQKAGRSTSFVLHPGGHAWGRAEDHESAIKWLAKLAEAGAKDPAKGR